MSDFRSIGDVISALEVTRDRLRTKADHADVAIEALRRLLTDDEPAEVLALPAGAAPDASPTAPAPPPHVDSRGHQVHKDRPRTTTCKAPGCGKTFEIAPTGRMPHYCDVLCRNRVNKAAATARASQRAARKPDVDALLSAPPPIPESGSAMRARIAAAAAGPRRETFLDRARERNDEAARRAERRSA